jgi:hypothetical protein
MARFNYKEFIDNCYWDNEQNCYVSAVENKYGSKHVSILIPKTGMLRLYKTFFNNKFDILIATKRFRPINEVEAAKLLLIYIGTAE